MIHIASLFVLLTLLAGKFSVRGRRLYLSAHPLALRLRYAGGGVLAGAWLACGELINTDPVAWLGLGLLALGAVRQVQALGPKPPEWPRGASARGRYAGTPSTARGAPTPPRGCPPG